MKTMGLDALYMVQPREFPHNDADVRASGARDVLQNAQVSDTLADALRGCVFAVATSSRRRELRHETMTARQAAQTLLQEAHAHRVALVFGNETSGLNGHEASLCNVWAHIPANPQYASLNLAAAVQIFAYELRMATETSAPASPPEFEPAAMEDVERLYRALRAHDDRERLCRSPTTETFAGAPEKAACESAARDRRSQYPARFPEVGGQRPQIRVRLAASDASNS